MPAAHATNVALLLHRWTDGASYPRMSGVMTANPTSRLSASETHPAAEADGSPSAAGPPAWRPPRLVAQACPLCDADEADAYLTSRDVTFDFPGVFQVTRCRRCAMFYTNPRVADEDVARFYPLDYSAHAADRAAKHQDARTGCDPWDHLPEIGRKRLLDVGCGSGAYLLRQSRRGWRVLGVEPSSSAVQAARRMGLEVVHGAIPGAELPWRSFEVVTMLGVLDHVPKPMPTLRALREMIVPEGLLIITVQNAASAAAELLGPDWPGWNLPRGHNHFTPATLIEMLHRTGFDGVQLTWKRRVSRWRRGAFVRAARTGRLGWRLLATSRNLCGLFARIFSRGERGDEIVAVARGAGDTAEFGSTNA